MKKPKNYNELPTPIKLKMEAEERRSNPSANEVPQEVIEGFARLLLPKIQEFYNDSKK